MCGELRLIPSRSKSNNLSRTADKCFKTNRADDVLCLWVVYYRPTVPKSLSAKMLPLKSYMSFQKIPNKISAFARREKRQRARLVFKPA